MFEYILHNLSNNSNEKCKLIAIMDCDIIVNYGNITEEINLVKNDEIRWDNNVIILKNNMNHYKSTVSTEKLIITSKIDGLKKIQYITPKNEIVFCGGWYDM